LKVELNTITITIYPYSMVPDFVRFTPDRWKSKMYLRLLVLLYSKETNWNLNTTREYVDDRMVSFIITSLNLWDNLYL